MRKAVIILEDFDNTRDPTKPVSRVNQAYLDHLQEQEHQRRVRERKVPKKAPRLPKYR